MNIRDFISEVFGSDDLNEEIVKLVFGLLGLPGAIAILVLSFTLGETVGEIYIKFAVPLLIMMAYWSWFKIRSTNRDYEYAFADSFYYMGFIFTLVALLGSFLSGILGGQAGMQGLNVSSLIGNLGIALSTTIVGLSGRVFIVSFEPNADNTYKEIQGQLRRSSNTLSRNINNVSDKIKQLEEGSFSALGEHTDTLVSSFASMSQEAEISVSNTREHSRAIRDASEGLSDMQNSSLALRSSFLETIVVSNDLGQQFSNTASEARSLAEAEGSLESVLNDAAVSLRTTFQDASTLIDQELRNALQRMNEGFNSLIASYTDESTRSVNVFRDQVTVMNTSLSSVAGKFNASAEQIGSGSNALGLAIEEFKTNIVSSGESLRLQREALESITRSVSEINASIKKFSTNLGETTDLSTKLDSIGDGLTDILKNLKAISDIDVENAKTQAVLGLDDSVKGFIGAIDELKDFAVVVKRYGKDSTEMIRLTENALIENLARTTQRIQD